MDVQISNKLQVDLILGSLTSQYEPSKLNYNTNQLNVNLLELLNILRSTEVSSKDHEAVFDVKCSASSSKSLKKRKREGKKKKSKKTNNKGKCHHFHKKGHWKRNYPD